MEDSVDAAFVLDKAVLSFQTIIVTDVQIRSVRDDVGKDLVCAVKEVDGAPVVRVGGVPFFKYGG